MYTKVVLSIVVCLVAQSTAAGLLKNIGSGLGLGDLGAKADLDVDLGLGNLGAKADLDVDLGLGNLGTKADLDVGLGLGNLGAKADLDVGLGNLGAKANLEAGLGNLEANAAVGVGAAGLDANVGLGLDLNRRLNILRGDVDVDLNLHLEAVIGPIDGYLPVEYVDPIDDNQSFGELSPTDLSGPSSESVLSDLVDRCKALLKVIKDYIVSKVRGVINTITKIDVTARVIIDSGANAFKRKLGDVVEKARQGIRRKITELKKDVGQCLASSEAQFKQMILDFITGESKCVFDEFHRAFDIAKNTKNAILGAIQRVEALPGEIANCLKGNDKFNCVKKDIWDVAKTEEQHFKNFVSQFTSAASFVLGFESRVAACALDHLERAGRSSLNIVEKFPLCVVGKILA